MKAKMKARKAAPRRGSAPALIAPSSGQDVPRFQEILAMIESARERAYRAINTELIDLYWRVGGYLSRKLETAEWGEGVVAELARHIQRQIPHARGFSKSNLFRMRQFHETYRGDPKVAALLRQLSWTQHMALLSRARRPEERDFYLRMVVREKWSTRDLDRQLRASLFERAVLNPPKVAAVLRQLHPEAERVFKDAYLVEFLGLPVDHSESDLHRGLVARLKDFIIELGRDFCFIGSEYPLQVGGRDFSLDLLFFHRGLSSLVAIELKVDRFEPEHLGKLEFYLEALDRDVRKPHERPSIGVLLCATKDTEVVEYALSRTLSPALIAEYQTQLPDKVILQRKLHEFYQLSKPIDGAAGKSPAKLKSPTGKSPGRRRK
jgi:predicted nuclease of restriction endonuclease-like (RecB) superfamily